MLEVIKNKNIICFSTLNWDSHWGTMHQIMDRLSQNNRILFVEPDMFRFKLSLDKKYENNWRKAKDGLQRVSKNLFIYKPFRYLPYRVKFNGYLDWINCYLISLQLKKIMRDLSFKKPILWFYSTLDVGVSNHLKHQLLVYNCVDEFGREKTQGSKLWRVKEEKLMAKADLIFTTSRELYALKKISNPNTYYIPNGVDAEHFINIANNNLAKPADIADIPRPIIGFSGSLNRQMDTSLLEELTLRLPNISFVFLGVVSVEREKVAKLSSRKNVYFLGHKFWKDTAYYLKEFDVCIMPYLNSLQDIRVQYVYPLKMHEYFAVGKPVVSSDVPSVREFCNYLHIAKDSEDWILKIKHSLTEDSTDLVSDRINVARNNDWNKRVTQMSEIISDYVN